MSFATPKDRVYKLQFATPYVAGSGSMVLNAGQGAAFTTFPVYFAAITLQNYATGSSEVTASYVATGITTDTLTGVAVLGGSTDQNFGVGDYIEERAVAQYILDLNAAVTTLDNAFPVSNANLQNSSVTINTGTGLSGGGVVALGGSLNLAATGSGGTVTTVSVASANGLAGTVATASTTPAITLGTTVTGVLKGNGTAIAAATAGTDYQAPISLTTTGTSGAATFIANVLNVPQYTGGSGTVTTVSVVTANGFTGTVANATTTPAITITTNVTGVLKGNGTAISAATAGTDYVVPSGNITGTSSNVTGTVTPAHGGTGLATLTANAVMLGEGTSNVGFATIGTAGRILVDQGAAADPSFKAISGDAALTSAGVLTVGAGAITLAKMAGFAASSLMGNPTGSGAAPSAITLGANLSFSGTTLVASGGGTPGGTTGQIEYNNAGSFGGFTMSGDATLATSTGVITVTKTSGVAFAASATTDTTSATNITSGTLPIARIAASAITYAKIQNATAHTLLGNPTGSAAAPSEITLGGGLSFSGTTLVASGGGSGTVTSVSVVTNDGVSGSVATATTTPAITLTLGDITPTQITQQAGGGIDILSLNAATLPAAQAGTVLQVANADTVAGRIEVDAFGAAAFLSLVRSQGSPGGTLTALTSGLEIGGANAWGHDGAGVVGPRAGVGFFAAENWSGTNQGTYTQLTATPLGGTTPIQTLQSNGSGGILIPGTVTGGDMGAGTVNSSGYFVGGLPVPRPLFACGACTAVTVATATTLLGSPANVSGSLTIPANTFTYVGQQLEIIMNGIFGSGGGTPTPQIAIFLGSTQVGFGTFTGAITTGLSGKNWGTTRLYLTATAIGASGAFSVIGQVLTFASATAVGSCFFAPATAGGGTPPTVDTTASQAFDFRLTIGAAVGSFQVLGFKLLIS